MLKFISSLWGVWFTIAVILFIIRKYLEYKVAMEQFMKFGPRQTVILNRLSREPNVHSDLIADLQQKTIMPLIKKMRMIWVIKTIDTIFFALFILSRITIFLIDAGV